MATITIKKKKPMTMGGASGGEAEETVATMGAPSLASSGAGGGKSPSYAIEAICAILTVFCFVALLLMQWVELQDYNKPPSAFLTPGVSIAS